MKVGKDVSIKNISNFYFSLREEFENNDRIIIDFSDSGRIDSSVVQIILAASLKAKSMNKHLHISGVSPELLKLLKLADIRFQ